MGIQRFFLPVAAVLTAATAAFSLEPDKVTVGWPEYPVAQKLLQEYARESGKKAPSPAVANTGTSRANMKNPEGQPTLGFLCMDPVNADRDGLRSIPVCSKGFVFYAHRLNPFLEKLAQREISPEQFRRIWFGNISWEELAGGNPGKTSVLAVAPGHEFLRLVGGAKNPEPPRAILSGSDGGIRSHAQSRQVLGAVGTDVLLNTVLAKVKPLPGPVVPLAYHRLPNGNFRLVRFGDPGGRGDREHATLFGEVLVEGAYLPHHLVFRTNRAEGEKLAAKLAEAGNRLGREGLAPFACLPLRVAYAPKAAPDRKFVYAHTMQCFLIGGIPEGFAYTYGSSAEVENFAAWPPGCVSGPRTWWSARLTPAVHKFSLDSARLDLDCAEKAGLDALGLLVYPGCLSADNPWNRGLLQTIRAAATHKVKVIFDLWGTFSPEWSAERRALYAEEHGRRLRNWLERYPDSFLKINGKTLIALGNNFSEFGQNAARYDSFFKALGGRENFYVIQNLTDSRSHNVYNGFEAMGDISTFWFVHCGWGDRVLDNVLLPLRKERNDRLCWGVSPGYYRANFGGNPNGGNVTEGFGACALLDRWREAIRHDAGGVYIQSWNDMGEDHHILESNFRGDTYLQLCGYFSKWFHTGREPEIETEKIFMFHRRQLKDAKYSAQQGRTAVHPSWSAAPLSDSVHIVTMLKQPGTVRVTLGGRVYELPQVGAGLREWLLTVPVKKDRNGNFPYWNKGAYQYAYPPETDFRRVTFLERLDACVPEACVLRDGKKVLSVVSRTGIDGAARFQILSVVGSVSSK